MYKPWGKTLSLDLFGVNRERITSCDYITTFIKVLVKKAGMVCHGPCYCERFGEGNLNGISALQFIETSSVTVHCDEVENRVFIDLFSCKDFDDQDIVQFCLYFFETEEFVKHVFDR